MEKDVRKDLNAAALEYHEFPEPGKIHVVPSKQLMNQRDLALAYSPGVAAPCEEIVRDPEAVYRYTARGNLVGVITNGTAVLGLGDIGPLAGKPVMEGKGVLFKKFSGIDVFDIEIAEKDPKKLVEIIASLEPTFGGLNLEDIKAPECFEVERELRARMKIPVFHDDQHGTAIVASAALLNALTVAKKDITQVKLVACGAGAAALACLDLLMDLGLPHDNIWVVDHAGVVRVGRTEHMDASKARYARQTDLTTLAQAVVGADIFLGLSAANLLSREMVATMAARPIIFALANPTPEILPEVARAAKPDAIIATGRSDYPNQVNNVLCFPYIFRGALDCGATTITRAMEIAVVRAIADLARAEQDERVAAAYAGEPLAFGAEYLIPKPFDGRLMLRIAPAVAAAAAASGVARRPITDMAAYHARLEQFVHHSGTLMRPVFQAAKHVQRNRVVYAEGEEDRVLRAVQIALDEELVRPILVGRPRVIEEKIERLGLRLRPGHDVTLISPDQDDRYGEYWRAYHALAARQGATPQLARIDMRRRHTLIAAMLLRLGEADGMICGVWGGSPLYHLRFVDLVIGRKAGASVFACMSGLTVPQHQLMLVDTHINADPSAAQIAEITIMAAEEMRRFGLIPRAALLSHSNFGSDFHHPGARKMREALEIIHAREPALECDGEMHGDIALNNDLRESLLIPSGLRGNANLLVLPNIEAANIAFNLLKEAAGGGVAIGPILLGAARPVHIMTGSATVRRIVNMTAITVAQAGAQG